MVSVFCCFIFSYSVFSSVVNTFSVEIEVGRQISLYSWAVLSR